jgi:hypothetical protein
MIDIKAFVKKICGNWEVITPNGITEDDLDEMVLVTTSGRRFKVKELRKNEKDRM